MTELHEALSLRFGEDKIKELDFEGQALLYIEITTKDGVQTNCLMTNGLSDYQMPVPEKYADEAFKELYFCLPSYWDLPIDAKGFQENNDPNFTWVYPWITRLSKFLLNNNTWFGHGHTMPCGSEIKPLSANMKQNYFILTRPILLEQELEEIQLKGKKVGFLAIIPLFPDEMDYKQGKGTQKFLRKLVGRNINENLDDYRHTCLKSNWRWNRG